jgi:hypothetical protein
VSRWADQSGEAHDAQQLTATNQPLWVDNVINGEPVVRFDGSDNYMAVFWPAVNVASFTIAAVIRPRDSAAGDGIIAWAPSPIPGALFFMFQRSGTNVTVYADDNYRWTIAHATDATKLYVVTWDGFQWNLYVDGTAQTPYNGGPGASRTTSSYLYLGSGYNGYAYVELGAVELYNRVLSSGDRGTLTTRLKTQYGIA